MKRLLLVSPIVTLLVMVISPVVFSQDQHFDSNEIYEVLHKSANWQLDNPYDERSPLDWLDGAMHTGIWALYEKTEHPRYANTLLALGQRSQWRTMNDIYHADRLTIAQTFADMYLHYKDPQMLNNIQWVMDMHIDRKAKPDVAFEENPYKLEWWSWCDALYMGPPAFARVYTATGDRKYLDYLDEHWWITSDYLYDSTEYMFYRDDRFFDRKTPNGEKVFWSRGNGWVMGGLVRVLEHLPEDYPSRERFVSQYQDMAEAIAAVQGEDGLWRSSLLDPAEFPVGESSGSAFFCYAMMWGINHGLLEESIFLPVVKKAWAGLLNNVNEAGRLGYVQRVGYSPDEISEDDWQVYGTGAFLLAGCEILTFLEE